MYKDSLLKMITAILTGIICGVILCSGIMLLSSFILFKTGTLPLDIAYILMQITGAVSAFTGGYIAVRIYKSNGLLIGLITSAIMFLIVFCIGLIVCIEPVSFSTLTKCIAMLCAGMAGGILSVNKRKKYHKR